jgi:hypothetical protein
LQAAALGVRQFPALDRITGVGPIVGHFVTMRTRAHIRTAKATNAASSGRWVMRQPSACA